MNNQYKSEIAKQLLAALISEGIELKQYEKNDGLDEAIKRALTKFLVPNQSTVEFTNEILSFYKKTLDKEI